MGLPQAAWVKLNRLQTGVGRFHSSMHKWGLAPSPNCECGASEQTTDHVLTVYPIHQAPHGARGLTVWDDETRSDSFGYIYITELSQNAGTVLDNQVRAIYLN